MDDPPKKKKNSKSKKSKDALQRVLGSAARGNADSGGLSFPNVSSEERPQSVAGMKGYEEVQFTASTSATGITTPSDATTPATSDATTPATSDATAPATSPAAAGAATTTGAATPATAAAVAGASELNGHSYDEMKFDRPKPSYDDITFHQLPPNTAAAVADNTKEDGGNIKWSMSGTYEVPIPSAVPSPSASIPPSAGGYMALNRTEPDKSVYRTPEEVGRPRRILNRLVEGLSVSVGRSHSHDDLAGENVDSACDKSSCCSCRRENWNCVLLVVSLVVAILAILLSVVALGLSSKCPSQCSSGSS